jgi:hypothetical protein
VSNKLAPLPSLKLADHRFRVCRQTLGRKRAGSHTECQIAGQFFERVYPGVHGARRALQLLGNQTDLDPGCDETRAIELLPRVSKGAPPGVDPPSRNSPIKGPIQSQEARCRKLVSQRACDIYSQLSSKYELT